MSAPQTKHKVNCISIVGFNCGVACLQQLERLVSDGKEPIELNFSSYRNKIKTILEINPRPLESLASLPRKDY